MKEKDAWTIAAFTEGPYRLSVSGRIYRERANGALSELQRHAHHKTGRVSVKISFRGRTRDVLVNRAVGLLLIPNPDNLPEVNHLDGDVANNAKSNLEWSNRSDQEKHAFANGLKSNRGSSNSNCKLTPAQVLAIRNTDEPSKSLASFYGVSVGTIKSIRSRKTWSHI